MADGILSEPAEPAEPGESGVPSAAYAISPLDKTEKQIRLLHLEPGKFGDPLKGTLQEAELASSPRYEALSYVCGCTDASSSHSSRQNNVSNSGDRKLIGVSAADQATVAKSRTMDRRDLHRSDEPRRSWPPGWIYGRDLPCSGASSGLAR